ncbi:hypothetical protein PsAD2_02699 [Pseudovibrio axinellae]|uniref:Uncharacterized protein n=1 Tax=Pseudovibrio axinellae TaxID=989403 RepID=A0A165XRD0_9HYPH|nr:hypothetical protein PsAD2_02699 [Pseudovibrio axinellae]SER15060.1 hypothetical protein SAMN05421798_106281 [Pseudovibrio axinellae]
MATMCARTVKRHWYNLCAFSGLIMKYWCDFVVLYFVKLRFLRAVSEKLRISLALKG